MASAELQAAVPARAQQIAARRFVSSSNRASMLVKPSQSNHHIGSRLCSWPAAAAILLIREDGQRRTANCWTRPGSAVCSLGVLFYRRTVFPFQILPTRLIVGQIPIQSLSLDR